MSSDGANFFTKENLDDYLRALGKEYRRINGKRTPAEIILIGGASIIANYGFRDMTADIDAIIHAASSMKDAINHVGDEFDLPNGWLNTDFMRTASYSPRLVEYSTAYRTFSNVLHVRTVSAEYLIAMKLRAGRKYKNDLSDILGILYEHEKRGVPLTMEDVDRAVCNLYGDWAAIPADAASFIREAMKGENLEKAYDAVNEEEKRAKNMLIRFEADYPETVNTENVDDILDALKRKKEQKPK